MDLRAAITERYRLERELLQKQLDAEEILISEYNASLGEIDFQETQALGRADTLAEDETRDLLPDPPRATRTRATSTNIQNEALANALRVNQESVDVINAEISALENTISQSNDLAEIQTLLQQIAEQIPETYRLRREALQTQFNYGEITKQALETGLANLDIEESAQLEQNADAQLANTLLINQEAIDTISVGIAELENRISESNDLTEIQTLLTQIASQIPEIYRLRREGLQSQYDAGEITLDALNTGISSLNIEESSAIEQNADAQLANTLLINQQAIDAISVGISDLENTISQSNDPDEIASLLVQIAQQIPEIFRLRRVGLQTQYDEGEITLEALNTGIATLNIEESSQLERNSDEQLANTLSINQQAVDAISAGISGLENSIAQSNDPTEIATLLTQIATQIPEIYRLRRDGLQKQYDAGEITLEVLNTGITNLNIEESAALEQNSDQQLANTLLINQEATESISTAIAGLENQIGQSNDPQEIATLLQEIATQIPEIYRLRREALQKQYDEGEITLQALNAGISNLNIEESAALERNSDEQLANTLHINQQAIDEINVRISGFENTISQSNDTAEIANLLTLIAEQIPEIYRLRRDALQKQYEAGEITLASLNSGIASLNIEESAALEQNSDQQLSNALGILNTDTEGVNLQINLLSDAIQNANDSAEIETLLEDLRDAIAEKYRLQKDVLQKRLDAEEITIDQYNTELGNINLQESLAFEGADRFASDEISDLRSSANNLIDNAIQRGERLLGQATSDTEFENIRSQLLELTNQYYDNEIERINDLQLSELELQDLREDNALARIQALERIDGIENQFAQDRLRREEQFADIYTGASRSREDLALGSRRRLEDTIIDESGFGGLGIGQAVGLESQLTAAIEGAGAGDFISNLEQNVADVLGDFSSTFLNRPSFSDEDIAEFERFALDQARGLQDIDREAGRAEADLLSEIASEEANINGNPILQ